MGKNKDREMQTITSQEVGKIHLPAVTTPPSLTIPAQIDEVGQSFGAGIEGQERKDVPGVPVVRIDHKQGLFTFNGNEISEVYGYPLYFYQARAWWKRGYQSGQTDPPDCWSPNMLKPSPAGSMVQAATCAECKWSVFGSASAGKGQACKTNTFLFLCNSEWGNPPLACLILPRSSIRALMGTGRTPGYLQQAKHFKDSQSGRKANYFELVWTRFTLEPGGDLHSVLCCEPLAVCPSADEARVLAKIRGSFMAAMNDLRGEIPSVVSGEEGS